MTRRSNKIKRYGSSWISTRHRRRSAARTVVILLAAVAVFGLGWFVASHSIDTITGFWYEHISANRPAESEAEAEPESVPESRPVEPEPEPQLPPEEPAPAPGDETGRWAEISLGAFGSEESLRGALQSAAASGADHAVVTLKDERGYVYYDSASAFAQEASAVRSGADIELFVRLCGEYGLAPGARLSAFRDPQAAYAHREAAVFYQNEGVLWLDSSQELGGKPWLNPYNAGAVGYVQELAEELAAFGFTDLIFANVQFPDGYALEFCYYGEQAKTVNRTDCLRSCVAELQNTLTERGANAWFEWPAQTSLAGDKPLVYGDAGTAALGAARILLASEASLAQDGSVQLPDCDAAALAAYVQNAQQNGLLRAGIDLSAFTGNEVLLREWLAGAEQAGFTHFKY